jgi:RimJ/RimL family protein N-acetyltransferase
MAWTQDRIATDRLVLRSHEDRDKPTLISLHASPEVRRYLGGPVDETVLKAIGQADVGTQWGSFCIAVAETDEAIGICSFSRDRGELEISYQLLPEWTGRGCTTEAVAAAIDWAWSHTDDLSIIAVTQTANKRSLSLLHRLGFVEESTFEEFGADQSRLRVFRLDEDANAIR